MNKKLKTTRELKGLTQVEMAIKVKISVRHYQSIEAATSVPNVETAILIAKTLNTTVEDLF